jgi:hypothetical protein
MRNTWVFHVFFGYLSESKNTLIFQSDTWEIHWKSGSVMGIQCISHVFLMYLICFWGFKNPEKNRNYLKYMRNTWVIHEQIHEKYIKYMYFSCIPHVFDKIEWEFNVYLMYNICILHVFLMYSVAVKIHEKYMRNTWEIHTFYITYTWTCHESYRIHAHAHTQTHSPSYIQNVTSTITP